MDAVPGDEAKRRRKLEGEGSQQPLPGGEQEGPDLISLLSDDLLCEIITRLPTKDAARTRIISSRWRHLWRSAPLNLDFTLYPLNLDFMVGLISRILSAHPGPGRRFSIPYVNLGILIPAPYDSWFRSPALDNLEELEFNYGGWRESPPPSAFRFSSTLRVATIFGCHLSDNTANSLCFPRLEQLTLQAVTISEGTLRAMLAGCPALRSLLLNRLFDCPRVWISSPIIRSIGVGVCPGVHGLQLIIEDAPCLERLFMLRSYYGEGSLRISVIAAPKLETLGCPSDRTTLFQEMRSVSLTRVMLSVKVLALSIYSLSLDMVINFMRCFPCTEKLYLETFTPVENNVRRRKPLDPVECLDLHLKEITLINYLGSKSHIDFAMFFVLNARVLELMSLEVKSLSSRIEKNDKWIENQQMRLKLENRASREARFDFTTVTYFNDFRNIKRAHDLSLADPFARK